MYTQKENLGGCGGNIGPPENFWTLGLENAVSSVLRRIVLANKNEQKYRNYLCFFFYLSLVLSVRYSVTVKRVKQ